MKAHRHLAALLALATAVAGCKDVLDIASDPQLGDVPEEPCPGGRIRVNLLTDETGPTAPEARPLLWGELDLIREINEEGGIGGCSIDYELEDSAYDKAKTQAIYDRWRASAAWDDVVAILGGASVETVVLAPQVAADRKPMLSGSYIASIASPVPIDVEVDVPEVSPAFHEQSLPTPFRSAGFPYNFFAGTDYSTGARIAMFFARGQGARRVGFFHCGDVPYCLEPVPAARHYARSQGLELGRDLILGLTQTQEEHDALVRAYFEAELAHREAHPDYEMVDWVWMGNLARSTAFLANAIHTQVNAPASEGGLGLNVQIVVNNYGFSEALHPLCPGACEGRVHGIMPFAGYGDARAPRMASVVALHDKWRALDAAEDGGEAQSYQGVRYVQGHVNVLMLKIAIERLVAARRRITGEGIKAELERFDAVDVGGLSAPLSFSPEDHRPQSTESIYTFDARGALVHEPPDRTIALQDDWLGW